MTNTEIRRANVATLRKEAKSSNINIDGMTRSDLVEALLAPEKQIKEEKPAVTVKLVKMVNADGFEANVHPDMVEDYNVNGGYKIA